MLGQGAEETVAALLKAGPKGADGVALPTRSAALAAVDLEARKLALVEPMHDEGAAAQVRTAHASLLM